MKPLLVPATRVVNIADLPYDAIDKILHHIKNIREKIRLSRVCTLFRDMVFKHLRKIPYRIVNRDDYLYQSEIRRGQLLHGKILNLSSLLRVAPLLTHFTDKMCQVYFDYTPTPAGARFSALSLKYLRYLELNLCDVYFFTLNRERPLDCRINLFLDDAPQLQTLFITVDRPLGFELKRSMLLKTFQLNYLLDSEYIKIVNKTISITPIPTYGILDGKAPLLEELVINTRYMNVFIQLNDILERITQNCSNLTSLSLFFHSSVWPQVEDLWPIEGFGDWFLPELHFLEIRGVIIPPEYWAMILEACPKLAHCRFSSFSSDQVFLMMLRRNIFINMASVRNNQRMLEIRYVRDQAGLYEGRFLGPD